MPATNQAVTLWAGDSLTIRIPIKAPDGTNPDLTGAKGRWRLAKSVNSGSQALVSKSTVPGEGGGASFAQAAGVWLLVISLAPSDTDAIPPSPAQGYYHEAKITDADGNVSTVMTGPFKILPTIVRAPV